ncbi:hypothetical protein ZWY2020_034035 [Hordeum vulgare]|nr:hypothetical protein ZWY2020_034035 [Hordeum vulgare]
MMAIEKKSDPTSAYSKADAESMDAELRQVANGFDYKMVGKGRKHSAAASLSAGDGMGTSIPASPLRRVLLSTLQGAPPVRGGRPPAKPRGTKGTRGRGRGRATRSPPPPQADSPEHKTSRVDSSEVEATWSPVHEPRVDEPQVDEPSTHETRVPEASFQATLEQSRDEGTSQETQWDTWPEPSGHAGSDEELGEGATVYQRGSLGLLVLRPSERWSIRPNGDKGWIVAKGVRKPNSVLGVLCRQNFPWFVTLPGREREEGMTWEHYLGAPAPPEVEIDSVLCDTRADMVIRKFWARHNKTEAPQMYDLYAMAHTASHKKVKAFSESDLEHPENFTNISSHDKLVKYRDHGKARKGEDFNPSEGPIDPELVMIASNGRPHGLIAIADGLIHCPSTLRKIKARQTSSCPEITRRPRPVELSIEAAIQKEREAIQAAMAEKDKEIRELEERTTALVEAERARNDASNRAIYELFVPGEGKEEEEEEKKKKEREEDKKKEKKEEKKEKELLLLLLIPPSSSFSFSFFFSSSSPLPSPSPPPPPSFTSSSLSLLLRSSDSSKKG